MKQNKAILQSEEILHPLLRDKNKDLTAIASCMGPFHNAYM